MTNIQEMPDFKAMTLKELRECLPLGTKVRIVRALEDRGLENIPTEQYVGLLLNGKRKPKGDEAVLLFEIILEEAIKIAQEHHVTTVQEIHKVRINQQETLFGLTNILDTIVESGKATFALSYLQGKQEKQHKAT